MPTIYALKSQTVDCKTGFRSNNDDWCHTDTQLTSLHHRELVNITTTVELRYNVIEVTDQIFIINDITVRLTFLTPSFCMRRTLQELPWFECDGLGEDEPLIRFLFN